MFSDVYGVMCPLLDGRVLVADNARFDRQFLTAEAQRLNVDLPVRHRL